MVFLFLDFLPVFLAVLLIGVASKGQAHKLTDNLTSYNQLYYTASISVASAVCGPHDPSGSYPNFCIYHVGCCRHFEAPVVSAQP